MEELVSFIIPNYNFAHYIEKCVKSILAQTYENIEVIVINDGSTDNSREIIDKLVLGDNRVKAIHKKNEGVSVARNTGIDVCSGDYVVFVDADDYLAPNYAEYMMNLVKQTGAEFCLSLNCYMNRDEKQTSNECVNIYTPEQATALLLSPRVVVGSWNKIFKKSFLVDNNLKFSKSLFYGEGLNFIVSAAQLSTCVGVGNRKVYYYRRNNYNSATSTFNVEKCYNGLKSIEVIKQNLIKVDRDVQNMWNWHKCQFCVGIIVRMASAGETKKYSIYYKQNLSYVRKHIWNLLKVKGLSLYNKGILIGSAVSPLLMAKLDEWRRKRIALNSISDYVCLILLLMGGGKLLGKKNIMYVINVGYKRVYDYWLPIHYMRVS